MTSRLAVASLLIGLLAGCAAPADSNVPSSSPAASQPPQSAAPAESTSAPTPTATPRPTGGGSGQKLIVPGFAVVTADRLQIRRDPGLAGEPVMNADSCIHNADPNCARPFLIGTENGYVDLYLFDGPREADGYTWYFAATEMHSEARASSYPEAVGWVAAGDDADAWLVPATRECPGPPVELADVTLLSMTRLEALHCFGQQALTLRGWYPEIQPGEVDDADVMESCRADRAWLACYSIFDILRTEPGYWAGGPDYLQFVADPDADVTVPARSQWIQVTGSFDHPAATTCGDPAAVLLCRSTFVISSAVAP